ncbi:uncharacterized protein LOC128279089 [Anopheles cruzii]|uniref:uncharacterized protein LOC128279089 n=1 Tax=Anopheles cruzii TaxID=68878 RepID=UPI0022EC8470|nr:uncharacterized protein LOC128279089 [Anopheles cruzii]
MNPQSRTQRKPPDVEEALSSMLWTPYDNPLSESDSSDESDALHRHRHGTANTSFFGTRPNHDQRRQQQSLMRRSLSAWSYRANRQTAAKPRLGEGTERFSDPYYCDPGSDIGVESLGFAATDWHSGGQRSHPYYGASVTSGSRSFHGLTAPTTTALSLRATGEPPWPSGETSVSEKHQQYLPLQAPFVGRWHRLPRSATEDAPPQPLSALPFSLLGLDPLSTGWAVADSYPADYQPKAEGDSAESNGNSWSINTHNNNLQGTCNNSDNNNNVDDDADGANNNAPRLSIISAMLQPHQHHQPASGDLHFSKQHSSQHSGALAPTPAGWLAPSGAVVAGNTNTTVPRSPAAHTLAATCTVEEETRRRRTSNGLDGFSSVRKADGVTTYAGVSTIGSTTCSSAASGSQAVLSGGFSGSGPGLLGAMRLNVPAADPVVAAAVASAGTEGSRTSVYIPSSSSSALTIQVNRGSVEHGGANNRPQHDDVVSIVSCYRAAGGVSSPPGAAPGETAVTGGGSVTVVSEREADPKGASVSGSSPVARGSVAKHKSSFEHTVQVSSAAQCEEGTAVVSEGGEPEGTTPHRTYTSTEAQTDACAAPVPVPVPVSVPMLTSTGMVGGGGGPGVLLHGLSPVLVGCSAMAGPGGSEFSTREHRRRERRERRQARNRMQHIHPLEPPGGTGPGALLHPHRSPPALEIIPDILHSHLPPPYTTLPLGATMVPAAMIPANAAAAAASIPVRASDDCRYTFPIPIMRSSPSERSRKGCCGHWFAGPPLRALIAVVALGGVACALGGAALGATGLAGSPTSHLTAALLMIGVGVILVTVSGAAWRMTAPGAPPCLGLGSTVDLGRCSRRPCGRGGSTPHGLLYPEFQHRPPPPSYQASMQEYRLRLLLLDRDRQSGRMRSTASPPPTYRSNVGSLLRIPLSSRYNGSSTSIFGGISGIISGAVGGSSNSVNHVSGSTPDHQHQQQQHHRVSSSPSGGAMDPPNPYGVSDGHSTLPPSYRSVELHPVVEALQRQPPPPPVPRSSSTGPTTDGGGGGSDDNNAHSNGASSGGSIIKIDDRVPIGAVSPCAAVGSGSLDEVPIVTTTSSTMVKDLVTIVTISGTIEPSATATGVSKSVYTTSNSSDSHGDGTGTVSSGGATCTLLNSNSTPLLATVIPVSKAAPTVASSTPPTVTGQC